MVGARSLEIGIQGVPKGQYHYISLFVPSAHYQLLAGIIYSDIEKKSLSRSALSRWIVFQTMLLIPHLRNIHQPLKDTPDSRALFDLDPNPHRSPYLR